MRKGKEKIRDEEMWGWEKRGKDKQRKCGRTGRRYRGIEERKEERNK